MNTRNDVEFADRLSRRRAIGTAAAAFFFLALQVMTRPVFRDDAYALTGIRQYMWPLNAAVLMLLVIPAAGLVWGPKVRALVNDDIARDNARVATSAGFWLAMLIALAIYVTPAGAALSAREATYLIVCPVAGLVPLYFAWLEARAHSDG